jgi:hypothetical protein
VNTSKPFIPKESKIASKTLSSKSFIGFNPKQNQSSGIISQD